MRKKEKKEIEDRLERLERMVASIPEHGLCLLCGEE